MNFKLWLEAFLSPSDIEKINQEMAKDDYAEIYIDKSGNIKPGRSGMQSGVGILPKKKEVHIRGGNANIVGGRVKSDIQKLLKGLIKAGLIEPDWSIDDTGVAEYVGYTFKHFPTDLQKHNVGDLAKQRPFTKHITNLTLYHGTSEIDWEKIKKTGFMLPLLVGKNQQGGFESRVKHKYNKKFVYLAATEKDAWEFGKTRARDQNRLHHPEQWKFRQYDSAEGWSIKPVLLRVRVPDVSRLRSDDDMANSLMKKIGRRLWSKMSKDEKDEIVKKTSEKAGYDTSSMADFYWWESDEGFNQLLELLPPKVYKAWFTSLKRYGQVAYDGMIPISHIEEIPIYN